MAPIRRINKPGRNEVCPCGSGRKFKKCCIGFSSPTAPAPAQTRAVTYIDTGEEAIRWVICNSTGTGFFSDKDNQLLVFTDRALAFAIAGLPDFSSQAPGEINVAGVGPTKFAHLCEKLPYIEVSDAETAMALVRGRIESKQNQEEGATNHGHDTQDQEVSQENQQDGQQENQQESHESAAQEAPVGEAEAGAGDQAP